MLDEYGNAARTTTRTIEHLLFPFSPFFLPTCQPEQTNVRGQAGGGATGVGPPTPKSGWSQGGAVQKVRVRKGAQRENSVISLSGKIWNILTLSALFLASPTFTGYVRTNERLPLGLWKIRAIPVVRHSGVFRSTQGFSGENLPFTQVGIISRRPFVPGEI